METRNELDELERKLEYLKKENNRLFASYVELRINQLLLQDQLKELRQRNEALLARTNVLITRNVNQQ